MGCAWKCAGRVLHLDWETFLITKSGYVLTAQAIAETDMPKEVRVALVERLVKLYKQDNPNFKEDEFRFLCRVYRCKDCENVEAGRIVDHYEHISTVHGIVAMKALASTN